MDNADPHKHTDDYHDALGQMGMGMDPMGGAMGMMYQSAQPGMMQYGNPQDYMMNQPGMGMMGMAHLSIPITLLPVNYTTGQADQQAVQSSNYYQEYCRLFIANVVLTTQVPQPPL